MLSASDSSTIRALVLSPRRAPARPALTIRVTATAIRSASSDDGHGHAIARTVADAPYLRIHLQPFDYPFGSNEAAPVQLRGISISLSQFTVR